jgi:hypothetical protein
MCRLVRDDQEKVIGVIFIALAVSFAREGTARGQAAAAEAGDGLHLDYRAPPACPDAAAFRAALSARNRRVAAGERVAESVEVTVTESGGRARGRVVIRAAGREMGTREVDGASCLEVVHALALVAALDLDAAPAAPRVHPPLPPDVHELPPEDPPPVPPPPRAPSWQLAVGAHASMMIGVADGLLFGAPVFLDFASASRDVFAPSARLLFEGTMSGESQEKVGALRVTWFAGGLEACPIRLGGAVLHLRPCARVEVGALTGFPENVSFGHSAAEPWLAAGAVVRGVWAPTRLIFLEIEGGGEGHLLRPQYAFLPGTTVYPVPPASALVELGLGVRFF